MMKVMLLAAGLGKRMQDLTVNNAKPLLPVAGKPLIEHLIVKLAAHGFDDFVINIHHQAQRIIDYLQDGSAWGVKINYSFEKTLLNTGGGVYNALSLLGHEPFLVVSSDIYCNYNWQKAKLPLNSLGHIVLNTTSYNQNGDFAINSNGFIIEKNKLNYNYANIAILTPKIVKIVADMLKPDTTFPLREVFNYLISQQKLSGEIYSDYWINCSTPQQLLELNNHLSYVSG